MTSTTPTPPSIDDDGIRLQGLWFFLPLPDRLPVPDGVHIPYHLSLTDMDEHQMHIVSELQNADDGLLGDLATIELSFAFRQVDLDADHDAEVTLRLWQWVRDLELNLVEEIPELPAPPTSVQTIVEVFVPTPQGGALDDRLEGAFEQALAGLQRLQRAYTHATGRPVRIVTDANLPPILPVLDGTVGRGPITASAHVYVNDIPPRDPTPPDATWTPGEIASFFSAATDPPSMTAGMDLQREAMVHLRRDGNYRAAALTAGIAGEVFLTTLHMWLLWEDGVEPDVAATEFGIDGPAHSHRVVDAMPRLLGGTWRRDHGPVGAYLRRTVRLRNQVAHAGYLPTRSEAEVSVEALKGMYEHALLQLSAPRSLRRYSRTASALCGNDFLRQHGRMTRRVRELQDADEPLWSHTFERWRLHLDRCNDPAAPAPGTDGASIQMAAESRPDEVRWFAVDTATLHAAELDASTALDLIGARNTVVADDVKMAPVGELVRVFVNLPALPGLTWVRQHTLLDGMPIHHP